MTNYWEKKKVFIMIGRSNKQLVIHYQLMRSYWEHLYTFINDHETEIKFRKHPQKTQLRVS